MNKKFLLAMVITIFAYALPLLVGAAVTGYGEVMWGFSALLLTFIYFWLKENDQGPLSGDGMVMSSLITLVMGVVLTAVFAITRNPNAADLVLIMWVGQCITYRLNS